MHRSLLALGLLALALPAWGQDTVPVTVLTQTQSGSGPSSAQQEVIRTPAGMSLVDAWLSTPAPFIEWGREVVVLVSLGTKPTGGYSVEVAGVTRHPMPGGRNRYEVQVRESAPSGPAIQIPTQPFQVVKFAARPQDPVVFVAAPQPGALSFRKVDLAVVAHMLTGPPATRRIVVGADASVEVWLDQGPGAQINLQGTATTQELQALSRAVVNARVGSLPAVIPTASSPPHPGFLGSPWTLRVTAPTAANAGATRGADVGLYGSYQTRLDPLIEATQQVLDRIVTATPPNPPLPGTISGEILVQGSRVVLRRPSGEELWIQPADVAAELRAFHQRYAELEGTVSGVPVPGGPEVIDVSRVVRPEFLPRVSASVLADADGQPTLRGVAGAPELQVVGPLRELLRGSIGDRVEVEAWALGSQANPTGVWVSAVKAKAKYTTRVYSGWYPRRLYRNRTAWIERVSRSGRYVLIRRGATPAGWVRAQALEVVASGPTPTSSAPTPGLAGGLPND